MVAGVSGPTEGLRLNLGCGFDRRPGWENVDSSAVCEPDRIVDLERTPWPWPDDAAGEILLKHVLEHLGRTPEAYLAIVAELWRICRNDARVRIVVPHPRHDHFLNDPTHVRAVTPAGLELFSRRRNLEWREKGLGNSPLALQLGIDFELESVGMTPDEPWRGRLRRNEIGNAELAQAARMYNNVVAEISIVLRAVKAPR